MTENNETPTQEVKTLVPQDVPGKVKYEGIGNTVEAQSDPKDVLDPKSRPRFKRSLKFVALCEMKIGSVPVINKELREVEVPVEKRIRKPVLHLVTNEEDGSYKFDGNGKHITEPVLNANGEPLFQDDIEVVMEKVEREFETTTYKDVVVQPGDPVTGSMVKLKRLYRQQKIGPAGHPWTIARMDEPREAPTAPKETKLEVEGPEATRLDPKAKVDDVDMVSSDPSLTPVNEKPVSKKKSVKRKVISDSGSKR